MSKKYVIAGNHFEAKYWIINDLSRRQKSGETTLSMSEYVIVGRQEQLRGVRDPTGVFVGTWRNLPCLYEILYTLLGQISQENPSHVIIQDMLRKIKL